MFKRILVAVDGSAPSEVGLKQAIDLASEQNAQLVIVHVIDDLPLAMSYEGAPYSGAELLAGLQEGGRKLLEATVKKVEARGVRCRAVDIETVGRRVADVILEQAKKLRADLIVLGTHGRRGIRRLVMGSDAEGVVREATVPVLLVRAHEKRAAAKRASR